MSKRIPVARWVVQGDWVSNSPIAVGGLEGYGLDSPVMRTRDGRFMLSGEGLCGALRSYLNDRMAGFGSEDSVQAQALLGFESRQEGQQSRLMVFDSFSSGDRSEIRDGIRRNPQTGIVEDKAKFDFEMAPRETLFPLRFELEILKGAVEVDLLQGLVILLEGLGKGEVAFGRYKTRGLGRGAVRTWRVKRFGLATQTGWLEWAQTRPQNPLEEICPVTSGDLVAAIQQQKDDFVPASRGGSRLARFTVHLQQAGGLLMAGEGGIADRNHLNSSGRPVVSGRGLAGALRQRALRIVNTLNKTTPIVENIFGPPAEQRQGHRASRVMVGEGLLQNTRRLFHTRVAIDPFTGGSRNTALFQETVVYGGNTVIDLQLRDPENHEIGLLLLVLRDLIEEDLPLGGTVGVGRGRMRGSVVLHHNGRELTLGTDNEALDSQYVRPLQETT